MVVRPPLVVLLFSSLCAPAWAQPPLTLQDARAAALGHNARLRAAHASAEESGARAESAKSAWWPRVSFGEVWQRGNQPVFVFGSVLSARRFAPGNFAIEALNHPPPSGFFRSLVGVEQVLFDAARQPRIQAARAQERIADAAVDEAAMALALAVTETFGRALTAQASGMAARAALVAGREDLRRAQDRRDAGMTTDADVLALVVYVADVERRAIQAEGEAAIARAELNRLMGAPIDRDLKIVEPGPSDTAVTAGIGALFAEAEAARPELQRAAAAEDLAADARAQARAAFIPSIAANAGFDASGLRFSDRASGWFVGGELRWSFSTGGAELAQLRAAASGIARAQAEREDARAAVHVDVVAAVRRLEAAQARQAAGQAAVAQAHEAERIVRDRYEAGIASVSDVLRASTAVLDAEANRSSALVEGIVSHALLDRAVGRRPL